MRTLAVTEDTINNTMTADDRIVPLAELERAAILKALERLEGDRIMAARMLGIGKTTLYRRLREYGITSGAVTKTAPPKLKQP